MGGVPLGPSETGLVRVTLTTASEAALWRTPRAVLHTHGSIGLRERPGSTRNESVGLEVGGMLSQAPNRQGLHLARGRMNKIWVGLGMCQLCMGIEEGTEMSSSLRPVWEVRPEVEVTVEG